MATGTGTAAGHGVTARPGTTAGVADQPVRAALEVGGRRLSYLDFGGRGRPLLALHGHFQEARSYALLARELRPYWRVIALDQRGHGFSDPARDYSREGYVADAAALLTHLGPTAVPVVGHSLGGVNAYQLAAWHPQLVSALVVEDAGAVIEGDLSFALDWPRRAPTRAELEEALGTSYGHVADAVREFADGWGLAFRAEDIAEDIMASQNALNGDHWRDWLAGARGSSGDPVTMAPAMLPRRPHSPHCSYAESAALRSAPLTPGTWSRRAPAPAWWSWTRATRFARAIP